MITMIKTSEKQAVTIVIFGGTGDLMKKKLVPAISELIVDGYMNPKSCIVGIARGDFNDQTYKDLLLASARNENERKAIDGMNVLFYRADSAVPGALDGLNEKLSRVEVGPCDRMFYLATSYTLFSAIAQNIVSAKLANASSRIVFEKPFGSDLKSAKKLEKGVLSLFKEEQIYRIDHYLGKETVQNILTLRFANPLIDHVLSSQFVDKIEIVAEESADVGNRLGYYNGIGALKDMVQNHLLQVASLVLMERPKELTADAIRDKKIEALKKLKPAPAKKQTFGQYESYQKELLAAKLPTSKTETFCNITLHSTQKRWKDTTLVLRTGKRLHHRYGRIIIHFRDVDSHHKHHSSEFTHGFVGAKSNQLIIDMHPTEDVKMLVNTRKRFTKNPIQLESIPLHFSAEEHFGPNTTDGYKRMLLDVMHADHTLFTRHDELLQSWKLIEEIQKIMPEANFIVYPDGADPQSFL
ncbi:MAG TPA: glucose-6-phosphate dehydrogenase [Acidobacteriota bacterium]|nr:glucose-6-phosphate dehydrogenase [Acidobacteriota bacterium]